MTFEEFWEAAKPEWLRHPDRPSPWFVPSINAEHAAYLQNQTREVLAFYLDDTILERYAALQWPTEMRRVSHWWLGALHHNTNVASATHSSGADAW